MNYHTIDLKTYPRAAHFAYFRDMANPYMGVTAEVDITQFMRLRREAGLPFYLPLIYRAVRAANDVPEFRRRIVDGGIREYDWCDASHTVAKPDGTYAYCALDYQKPLREFLPDAIARQEAVCRGGDIGEGEEAISYFFCSSLPWLTYTALVQPTPSPADSNPRLTWGKYFERDGKTILPFSVLCHHALVDGLHLSRFYEALAERLNEKM